MNSLRQKPVFALIAVGALLLTIAAVMGTPWPTVVDNLDRISTTTWCAIVGLTLLGGALLRVAWTHTRNTRWIGIRWGWTALVIVVPLVMLTALALLLLLAVVDTSQPGVRIDVIKTALGVGAGTGAVAALLLASRKQWAAERAADETRHDASERRITDLYTKAADQLGNDRAAVRLAGLYALERVGQNHPSLRQTIVDVICAYLRMPSPDSALELETSTSQSEGIDSNGEQLQLETAVSTTDHQEAQVRETAQRILTKHLIWPSWEAVEPSEFWAGMDIDLSGARLVRLNMENARVRRADFGGTTFVGQAFFARAMFDGEPWGKNGPTGTGGAVFDWADFAGGAVFEDAVFRADASFYSSAFQKDAYFGGANFHGKAEFDYVTFKQQVLFEGCNFFDMAEFSNSRFVADVSFGPAVIYAVPARFRGKLAADFHEAIFEDNVSFKGVLFEGGPSPAGTDAVGVDLNGAIARVVPDSQRIWPGGWIEDEHPTRSDYKLLVATSET